jgi:hypothetical protein
VILGARLLKLSGAALRNLPGPAEAAGAFGWMKSLLTSGVLMASHFLKGFVDVVRRRLRAYAAGTWASCTGGAR